MTHHGYARFGNGHQWWRKQLDPHTASVVNSNQGSIPEF